MTLHGCVTGGQGRIQGPWDGWGFSISNSLGRRCVMLGSLSTVLPGRKELRGSAVTSAGHQITWVQVPGGRGGARLNRGPLSCHRPG
jgi:hypothetical protein